jgi:zeaxanthin glucosyltransferase
MGLSEAMIEQRQHFGIISPPVSGHLHPFGALGRELQRRGHRVTVFQVSDLEAKIASEGLGFALVGESDHPAGSLPTSLNRLAQLDGLAALRFTIAAVQKTTEMMCRELPAALAKAGVTALLVDQMEPAGGSVAECMGLPFITVCNALLLNREPDVPPPFTPWNFEATAFARLRNRVGHAVSDRAMRPVLQTVARYRELWRLPRQRDQEESFSRLAQISQMPKSLDFPRMSAPDVLTYVGPLRDGGGQQSDFPWERCDGRPLVYASLGTLQNQRTSLFRCFAQGCHELNLQMVLTHGGGVREGELSDLPGNPIVVSYAPQREVIRRAALTLTHAGLNTVLDSLAFGVPIVAIPITYEQPAIARRVEWAKAGLSLSLKGINSKKLVKKMRQILENATYQTASARIAKEISYAGGVQQAVSVIEGVLTSSGSNKNLVHSFEPSI